MWKSLFGGEDEGVDCFYGEKLLKLDKEQREYFLWRVKNNKKAKKFWNW